ncbi:MAG: CapA family protein [Gemmatimonadota bacterium]|nr:CapA family protein [Gemmatimonadota bacterium]
MRAEPELAGELAWLGFDMVSTANNHSMDFGVGGMRRTLEAAEAAGLVTAGTGDHLAEARAPGYLETPGGRVALISIASTFADPMRAGHQRPDMRGRPGLSPIRYETEVTLTSAEMAGLRSAAARLRPGWADADVIRMAGVTFRAGADPGVTTRPHAGDLAEIVAIVGEAERQADWVLVTSHSHEGAGDRNVPADFLVEVARAVVDAGADMFIGHGPHVLRGVEVYQGRPIFYSLANFIFQNETVELQPHDNYAAYGLGHEDLPGAFQDTRIEASGRRAFPADPAFWESVVPVVTFEGGGLQEIRLHPITLGHGLPRPVRGRPLLADEELGREILEELAALSAPFGTVLAIEDGVGTIRP